MSLMLMLYLADVVESLSIASMLGAIVFGILFFCLTMEVASSYKEDKTLLQKYQKLSAAGIFVLTIISVLTPTKKTIYMMTAVKFGQDLTENEKVQALGSKVFQILNQKLDEMVPKTEVKNETD